MLREVFHRHTKADSSRTNFTKLLCVVKQTNEQFSVLFFILLIIFSLIAILVTQTSQGCTFIVLNLILE